jgi:HK97 family phage prohead protease
MSVTLAEAAEARAAATPAPADRPRERRCAEEPSRIVRSRVVTRHPLELRAAADGGDGLDFSGYASVTERGYEMWDMFGPYTELVSAGAFAKTLAQADLDVPLVLNHDSLRRIARTTNGSLVLSEDETGLLCVALGLDASDVDVAYIAPKIRAGLIDEMSFRFAILAGRWSPDYTEYRIDEVDIDRGDVAIVGYGANPFTSAELRSALKRGSEVVSEGDLAAYRSL